MSMSIRELNQHFIDLWWESDLGLPDLSPRFTAREQAENEKQLSGFLEQVEHILSDPPRGREEFGAVRQRLGAALRSLADQRLGFTPGQLELLPSKAFSDASEEFVRMSRAFDPDLRGEDIYQAGRNAWTACGLQWLLGLPVQTTPSILGYSLLYPYTDNYLDDPEIGASSKRDFNERLRRRLQGEAVTPANEHERAIFDLVEMIEDQYPRHSYPQVFESLLAIHRAQGRSLELLRGSAAPGEVDVLGLGFEKGGTSVLADGYLVSGLLTDTQREYTYGHGIFAQLLDDMEDVEEDSRAGRLTLYSQPAGHWTLDALANRTFHFGRKVLLGLDCFDIHPSVRAMIGRGADLLLIDAIARRARNYTPAYLRELEA
ncbi:MAG TPA: hypothetical protein VFO91_03225, partial [Anaerolineales bacterium]|nr:hypothetical protein [Anaerolineales bacterium]